MTLRTRDLFAALVAASLCGVLLLLWGFGLSASRFGPLSQDQPQPAHWHRGQPHFAGCEITQKADSVRITIPGVKLETFESDGLNHLPATEAPFANSSAVSLRLKQSGIGEQSEYLGGGPTNRPCTEAGIHFADATGKVGYFLFHKVVYYHEVKKYKHHVGIMARGPKGSFTSDREIEPKGDFVGLKLTTNGSELFAWYSEGETAKWNSIRPYGYAIELDAPLTAYGVCAFSNADSTTVFEFTDIKVTPNIRRETP
jgi:hypothetical protein